MYWIGSLNYFLTHSGIRFCNLDSTIQSSSKSISSTRITLSILKHTGVSDKHEQSGCYPTFQSLILIYADLYKSQVGLKCQSPTCASSVLGLIRSMIHHACSKIYTWTAINKCMPSRSIEIQYGRARKHLPLKGGECLDESIITFQEPIYPKNEGCSVLLLLENQSIHPSIKTNNFYLKQKTI